MSFSDVPEPDEVSVFQDALSNALTSSGVLGQIRAQLRLAALEAIGDTKTQGAASLLKPHPMPQDAPSQFALALVAEFLSSFPTLKRSHGIFVEEAGAARLPSTMTAPITLAASLGLSTDSTSGTTLHAGTTAQKPVLTDLVEQLISGELSAGRPPTPERRGGGAAPSSGRVGQPPVDDPTMGSSVFGRDNHVGVGAAKPKPLAGVTHDDGADSYSDSGFEDEEEEGSPAADRRNAPATAAPSRLHEDSMMTAHETTADASITDAPGAPSADVLVIGDEGSTFDLPDSGARDPSLGSADGQPAMAPLDPYDFAAPGEQDDSPSRYDEALSSTPDRHSLPTKRDVEPTEDTADKEPEPTGLFSALLASKAERIQLGWGQYGSDADSSVEFEDESVGAREIADVNEEEWDNIDVLHDAPSTVPAGTRPVNPQGNNIIGASSVTRPTSATTTTAATAPSSAIDSFSAARPSTAAQPFNVADFVGTNDDSPSSGGGGGGGGMYDFNDDSDDAF